MANYFDYIDDYVNNKLSMLDKTAFEKALETDKKLQLAVENYTLSKNIALGFLDIEVRQVLENEKNGTSKNTKVSRILWVILLLILIFGIFYFYKILKTTENQSSHYAELYVEPNWPIERSENNSGLSDALVIALDGDVNSAVEMLRQSDLKIEDKNYWIAEIFAKNKLADSVLVYLPNNVNEKNKRDRINYLQIISHLLLNNQKEVNLLIRNLPKDTDEWYLNKYKLIE